ncbi:hypothetical protein [Ramlibacter sp.]
MTASAAAAAIARAAAIRSGAESRGCGAVAWDGGAGVHGFLLAGRIGFDE